MSNHSIVEARNQLSALIERALKGGRIVITRHGHPVVGMRPVNQILLPAASDQALDWLAERRALRRVLNIDAVDLVRKMRDQD